jgi:hypothetical protein
MRVPLFWFFTGMMTTVAVLCVLLPWLRTIPRFGALPALPWQAPLAGLLLIVAALALYRWLGRPELVQSAMLPAIPALPALPVLPVLPAAPGVAPPTASTAAAGSMQSALASLEARLAKGGGTPDDWELLAKSYEFLGRADAAAQARKHELPVGGTPTAAGMAVSGEVSLSNALRGKVPAGSTLFIVAKSVDSPGAPVAVYRGSVGAWPVTFTLDDSQSMLPGRNLSSAGRVTIEARISQSGQAVPASGDLRGSSGVINPADRHPLKILIDEVIS